MISQIREYLQRIPKWVTNPFLIVILVFAAWMLFFDENDLLSQYRKLRELSDLMEKKKYYQEQIKKTDTEFQELTSNPVTQEKFAREHYYMKKDNEDVFVIVQTEKQ